MLHSFALYMSKRNAYSDECEWTVNAEKQEKNAQKTVEFKTAKPVFSLVFPSRALKRKKEQNSTSFYCVLIVHL